MFVFLTLVYVALLVILVKIRVIKLNLFWKLSPLFWMLILFVVLFIPMQWGAPVGQVVTIQKVVEIVPNVSGEVVGVEATSMEPKKQGDVLFRIDPVPFQQEVSRLEAALVEAEQNARALPLALESAMANVRKSEVAIADAEQQVEKLRAAHEAATANVSRANAELELAKTEEARAERLAGAGSNAIAQAELDAKRLAVKVSTVNITAAKAAEEQARLAHLAEFEGTNTGLARAEQQLKITRATEQQAQLALDSVIDGENTRVLQLRAQLAGARFTLEQTEVRAPADGFVMAMTLRPGQRVAQMPLRAAMAFVETDQKRIIVGVHQKKKRHSASESRTKSGNRA